MQSMIDVRKLAEEFGNVQSLLLPEYFNRTRIAMRRSTHLLAQTGL